MYLNDDDVTNHKGKSQTTHDLFDPVQIHLSNKNLIVIEIENNNGDPSLHSLNSY